jgi:hypothetical protein
MTMSPEEIRLKCVELAIPAQMNNWDPAWVVQRAEALLAFVLAGGENRAAAPAHPAASARVASPDKPPAAPAKRRVAERA